MQDPAVKHLIDVLLDDQRKRYSGGVERLLTRLSTEAGRQSYGEWRKDPLTVLFLDALKAMAETGAGGMASDATGLALAHGSLCGLGLAARLIDDPTRVFPSIFDADLRERAESSATAVRVEETYTQPPEDGEEG
jgi:hypothetical protein